MDCRCLFGGACQHIVKLVFWGKLSTLECLTLYIVLTDSKIKCFIYQTLERWCALFSSIKNSSYWNNRYWEQTPRSVNKNPTLKFIVILIWIFFNLMETCSSTMYDVRHSRIQSFPQNTSLTMYWQRLQTGIGNPCGSSHVKNIGRWFGLICSQNMAFLGLTLCRLHFYSCKTMYKYASNVY